MKLLSTILLVFFAGIFSIVLANEDDKIVKSSRDFSLRYRSLKTTDATEKRMPVTVYSAYSSKDQQITINIDWKTDHDSKKAFKLNYPLDFEVFKQKFDSLLNDRKSDSLFVYYGSHLDVFYWMVTITEDGNLPLAGTLTTSQYVMLLSSNKNHKTYYERAEAVKKAVDSLELAKAKLKNLTDKKKFLEKNEQFNDTLQKILKTDPYTDTLNALEKLQTTYPTIEHFLDSVKRINDRKKVLYKLIVNSLIKQKQFDESQIKLLVEKPKDSTHNNLGILKTLKGYYPGLKSFIDSTDTLKTLPSYQEVIQKIKKQNEINTGLLDLLSIDTLSILNLVRDNLLVKNFFDSIKANNKPDYTKLFEDLSKSMDRSDISNAEIELQKQLNTIEQLRIHKVSHVQYQFENGYLERIQVYIESPGTDNKDVFENSYPIGFSSISNYGNFTATRLYRRGSVYGGEEKDNYIFLSDVIKLYENQLNTATRDYSPSDTTVTVDPSSNPISRLNKQRNFYIIDGKTFTDITGLSEHSPNGLVQVELCRRFNLWTHRIQVRGSNNYGFVNYVIAKVNFSKIENKLKGLPLRNQLIVENNAIVSPSYATNLDYLRYENLGFTFDLNLFLFDAPDFKYTFFLDAGIHYGHTPIIDSNYQISQGVATTNQTVNELDAHNFTIFPRAKLQLFAERRYGLSLSYQANYTWLFTNNRFKQVLSYSGKGQDLNTLSTNKLAHWSHMVEAAFYIDVNPTSSTGKIFTTARFFFQQGDVNTFYPQILLGYAFNIFK